MKQVFVFFLLSVFILICLVHGRSLGKQDLVSDLNKNNGRLDPLYNKRSATRASFQNSPNKKRAVVAGLVKLAALIGKAATKSAFWGKLLGSLKSLAKAFPKQIPNIISYGEMLISQFEKQNGMSQSFKDFDSLHATNAHTTDDGDGFGADTDPFTDHVGSDSDMSMPTFEDFIKTNEG